MHYGHQPPHPHHHQPYRGQPVAPPKPGCLMPVVWLVATLVITLVCAVVVGGMASTSESKGVEAAQWAAMPFGFVWGGLLSAVLVQLAWKKASPAVRVAGPLGCGCLGAIVMIGLIVVFFAAIFPAL